MKSQELITKYLNNEASQSEIQELKSWIDKSEENRNEFALQKNSHALLASQIATGKSNSEPGQILVKNRAGKKIETSLRKIYGIAASVFFPVLLIVTAWLLYTQYQKANQEIYTEFIAPPKHNSQVILSDGTHVWLSPESSLKYTNSYGQRDRTVELKGEGYFEVEKNPDKPFIIEMDNANITVLGTSFNVEAYPEDKLIRTTIVRGSVEIASEKLFESMVLTPGDQFTFDMENNNAYVEKVNTEIYRLVKDGLLLFKRNNLSEICRKLERWYMIPIEYDDTGDDNLLFTAKFEDESIETILKIVNETIPINYKYINNQIKVEKMKKQ